MQAQLVFAFPTNVDAQQAIMAVAAYFGATVSINGQQAEVPAYIKAAVENTAAALGGQEMSAAVAFGGLLNGDAGNASAAPHAPSTAGAATLPTAPGVNPATLQTTPPASSAPALLDASAGIAPVASAEPTNHANSGVEFDLTGLAWDERIHSGAKSKTPKGEWRSRKGTDKSVIKTVEAELRAKYPNGAGNATAQNSVQQSDASQTAQVGAIDPAAKRAAALEYAHAEALRVAGPQMVDDKVLTALNNGQATQLTPQQNEWYGIYYSKRNAAFTEYMQCDITVTSGNVAYAPAATDANASQAPIGNAPAASAVMDQSSGASQTAAVGKPVAPTAPQGVELDAAGLPHDPRINVGAKIKDNAGVWVQRHDVPPQLKLEIIAELRAALAAGNGAAAQSSVPSGADGATPVVPNVAPTAQQAGESFPALMKWIVHNQMQGRIKPSAGPAAAAQLGFVDGNNNGSLVMMSAAEHATFWPYVVQLLQSEGAQ